MSTPFHPPDPVHLEAAVRLLVERFDPLQVLVFGSHARGDAGPGSDLDLLLVLPHVEHKREAAVAARRALAALPLAKDVVVTTPEEIERRRGSTWHIVGAALREGREVYARPTRP